MLGRQSIAGIRYIRFYESCLILLRAIPSSPAPLPKLARYTESFRGGRGEPKQRVLPHPTFSPEVYPQVKEGVNWRNEATRVDRIAEMGRESMVIGMLR
ncbi:MAG: hypothetical protein KDD67_15380, partial [Ignavibacteriae bacterium]|nr:hypothetical protein [Ignavibacteriota bacterium]